jgi:hypothetical protein
MQYGQHCLRMAAPIKQPGPTLMAMRVYAQSCHMHARLNARQWPQ